MRSVPSIKVCIALMFFAAGAQAAHMVADINAVAAARGAVLSGWVQQGSNALFLMDDRIHGKELWRTDGTRAGTALVKDIAPGPASSGITALTPLNGVLYFLANDGTNGQELWRSDGTTSGTHIVADINAGSGDGAAVGTDSGVPIPVLNGVLYFAGTDAAGTSALWRSDGTSGGTYRVSTGSPAGEGGAPFQIAATASRIFFDGFDAAAGEELWISDGTQAGTHRVVDIRPGNQSSFPDSLTATSAGLFFTADDGTHGRALWFADDTSAHVVTNLDAENPCLNFGKLTAFGADVIANAAVPIGPSCGSNVIRANSTAYRFLPGCAIRRVRSVRGPAAVFRGRDRSCTSAVGHGWHSHGYEASPGGGRTRHGHTDWSGLTKDRFSDGQRRSVFLRLHRGPGFRHKPVAHGWDGRRYRAIRAAARGPCQQRHGSISGKDIL